MKRSVAAFLLIVPIVLISGIARAQSDAAENEPAVEVSKSDVLEWVDQLDADKLSQRKAAEKSLIEAGVPALEFLPEKRTGFSIEATERLGRVRAALVALKAKSQAKAIRIRLGEAKTLGEALEVISRESGVEFEHMADESLPIQPPATPLSFWHAVDIVLDQTSLDVNPYGGDGETLELVARAEGRLSRVDSAAYSGVYRLEPTSVSSRRVFNSSEQNGLNLSMQITWQPGMTPIGLTIPVGEIHGKYDDQGTLRPQSTQESIEIATNNEMAFSEFFLPLELPVDRPQDIATLQGTIQSLLPGKQHEFEFDLTKPGTKQTVDSMTVELEQVSRNGDLFEVRIAIDLEDADRALESHRQWIFQNEVRVTDGNGSDRDQLGYELYRQTDSSVGLAYFFDIERLDGAKLVYRSPTSVTKNAVDFVLEGIALP
ncbi:MAG: hypothetical protein AAFU85_25555 [Planctomycetota bacterium]